MVQRQGPPLRSLIYDKAIEADHVMRQEVADSHQGQERDRSDHRPDRFTQPKPDATIRTTLRREASIDYRKRDCRYVTICDAGGILTVRVLKV